ncbi:hypothetical protein DFH07DRAFT_766802 [Mycena maculata]|uniref:Extracellular mutant protein 11 C-terminal domain-containing protein n=1 Tax=Mycena maculata TaxID=230809 RepID=A0AAD7K202_9AGAR|nr:hypothetical protein DFH07DRAFT_766802 [Mycena maculata]
MHHRPEAADGVVQCRSTNELLVVQGFRMLRRNSSTSSVIQDICFHERESFIGGWTSYNQRRTRALSLRGASGPNWQSLSARPPSAITSCSMSARQPFIPGTGFAPSSRPESRSAHASTATNNSTSTPHFVADSSNPLNGEPIAGNTQKDRIEDSENRPLNIGSLTKSNRSQNPPSSRRSSLQTTNHIPRSATSDPLSLHAPGHPMRPGTSDPHSKSHTVPNHRLQAHSLANAHSIVAPTPLQARSAPSMFSNPAASFSSSFKTPALPTTRVSSEQHAESQTTDQNPASADQPRDDIVPDNPAFRLKTLSSQRGPHRLVFGARAVTNLTQEEDEIYEIPDADANAARSGNARNKRGRSEVDDDDDDDDEQGHMQGYGGHAKRFKGQQQVVERQNDEGIYLRSNDGNEIYHRSPSPHEVQEYPPPQQPRHRSGNRSSNPTPAAPGHRVPQQYSNSTLHSPENSQHTSDVARLLQLFKAEDLDLACDARIEKYTRLSEKWKTCTREEWLAGADELTANYAKIFDFVKSHMTAKVQLFATCDGRLQQQTEVLKDRETLLAGVKDKLVAESGSVLAK